VPDDVMKNAVISAWIVYSIANREKMMPRLAPDQMPPLAAAGGGGRGGGGGAAPTAESAHVRAQKNKPLTIPAPACSPPTRQLRPRAPRRRPPS
jgi:hypothetical protein